MTETKNEATYQPMTFDAIKLAWRLRKRFWNGLEVR